jgi:serine/threonine protein kinase
VLKESAKFNNKVDIWALGCIIYELGTGAKLFSNDWAIMKYITTGGLDFPISWPMKDLPSKRNNRMKHLSVIYTRLSEDLRSMVDLEPLKRLKAEEFARTTKLALKTIRDTPIKWYQADALTDLFRQPTAEHVIEDDSILPFTSNTHYDEVTVGGELFRYRLAGYDTPFPGNKTHVFNIYNSTPPHR